MTTLVQDVRFALRMMLKSPAFTAVAVITLAVGIGANATIFSVIDAIALRPLGVADPARIVRITNARGGASYNSDPGSSWPEFEQFRADSRTLSGLAACDRRAPILKHNDVARRLLANMVSPNYFDVMSVTPLLGRVFSEREVERPGAPPVVLLSYDLWQREFNGDPQLPGKTIVLNDTDRVVLGILPRQFRGTEYFLNPDIYVPITAGSKERRSYADRGFRQLELFGRMNPGVTAAQVQTELSGIQKRMAAEFPKTDFDRKITVATDRDWKRGNWKNAMRLLFAISGLVLLIACANVTNLLLARGEARRREIATRLALGARRLRLLRQSLTESLLLAALAGAAAILLVNWIIHLLPALMPPTEFPIGPDFRLDARVLIFAAVASLLAVVFAGLFPAFVATRCSLMGVIKEQDTSGGRRPGRVRDALVVGQMAVAIVLLVGAGLLLRRFMAVQGADPGFDSHRKMLIATLETGNRTREQEAANARQILQRVASLPGVQGTALAGRIPMWGSGGGAVKLAWVPGLVTVPGEDGVRIGYTGVTAGYFSTIGTRIVRGRAIGEQDTENSPRVAVLNESAARLLWPKDDAVSKHFRIGGHDGKDVEVVGIAQDGRYNDLTEQQRPYMFLSWFQEPSSTVLLVGAAGDPRAMVKAVRQELASIDRSVLMLATITMEQHLRYAMYGDRLITQFVTVLGALALLLAAIGLYGVISYLVNQRTHEIGIRLALGAEPRNIFRLVVKRGLILAGIAAAIGLAASLAFSRLLSSELYGISPRDPLTFAAAVAVLLAVALLALSVPARRATRVDPMIALRYE